MKYAAVELSVSPTNRPLYHIPLPKNKHFVGRQTILHKLNDFLFVKESQKVAIVGLGGVGKTQVALQVAYWAKENKPEYSVFWLPALSDGSFEQACARIVEKLDIRKTADDEDPRETVRRHLSSEVAGKWLLIVDNADEMELLFGCSDKPGGINKYLQVNEDGLILFTTRSQEVAVSVAGGDVVELPEMDPQEAKRFLEESLIGKELLHDEALTMTLLDKLTYLPLAITQAAAYLNTTGVPMAEYLNLLRGADQEAASLMSREFHDSTRYEGSQNAVATTWIVSFDQIRRSDGAAADLLAFMSCIEPKAIPQSMLPRCELEEEMVKVFDMHSLVYLATRIWIQREGRVATTSEAVI
ncbi:hypothetical protein FJTKL_01757 [Diaporthe vaccinii]|uniref:NB-ARC domain-containing protein n=1 Tax=Diaporthe vaccinii TaxID=105482 RepID=A0ABR4F462_9PEZI